MASSEKLEPKDDLNDSWVELHYGQSFPASQPRIGGDVCTDPTVSYTGTSLEKLLIDAQRESRTPSRPNSNVSSAKGSPNGPSSPNTEWSSDTWRVAKDPGTDWIWDWSSQPELPPPYNNWGEKFRHPGSKPGTARLSMRNSQVIKKTRLFSLTNLPTLLFTHACTFFLGAAAVIIYFKKYYHLPAIAHVTID